MSSEIVQQSASQRIAAAFDLAGDELEFMGSFEEMRAMLINRITELLSRNPEKLMAILYRIDVKEAVVHQIMSTSFPLEVPIHLADLIITRQLEKAQSRADHARAQGDES
ncbi:MAG: hypothetical protein FJ211_02400 [Ignavibacteria bacterium]|nr:hypothetical protein [Ignavibacteria bacterium]